MYRISFFLGWVENSTHLETETGRFGPVLAERTVERLFNPCLSERLGDVGGGKVGLGGHDWEYQNILVFGLVTSCNLRHWLQLV